MDNPFTQITRLFLRDKNYREFIRLLFLYGNVPRYRSRDIRFLNYRIIVPDCPSFIHQYKEIFVKQYYLFSTESESPVIYDCGANIGISTIFFKRLFPNSRIKAFEADKDIADILRSNLLRNKITDVEIIPAAVWIHDDGIEFSGDKADAGTIYGEGNKILVDSIRLKDFIEKEDRIDFLKLDIEGAETDVIEDIGKGLTGIKNVFIEYHSFIKQQQNLDKILLILKENNFRYFINSVYDKQKPFWNKLNPLNPDMDLQLNIFAYK